MLDGISDIASSARTAKVGDVAWQTCVEELQIRCTPSRVQQLLAPSNLAAKEQRRNTVRATRLLRKASIAAKNGNQSRCALMRQLAQEAVNGDQSEIDALIEEHRFCFTPRPPIQLQAVLPRVRMGFAG